MFKTIIRVATDSYHIALKDLAAFGRDRFRLLAFVFLPIFMMVMTGYIFPTVDVLRHATLGIVNLDPGPLGAEIVSALSDPNMDQDAGAFKIAYPEDQADAVEGIRKQQINGAIVIPADFSAKIAIGEQATLTSITDQSNPQISMMMSEVLDRMTSAIAVKMGAEKVTSLTGITDTQALIQPFVVETVGVVPGEHNYFEFMAPGIMAMVIMLAGMNSIASSIARERELGTLDGILSAPISRLSVVVGKTIAQGARGLLQAALTLMVAIVLFGVVVHGNLGLLTLLLVLNIFSFIGLGIIISALSPDQETASTIMLMLDFPMLYLSGALFPVQQMPTAMQWISKAIPLSYSVEALRKCIALGTGISGMTTEMLAMFGFGIVFLVIAVPVFNKATVR